MKLNHDTACFARFHIKATQSGAVGLGGGLLSELGLQLRHDPQQYELFRTNNRIAADGRRDVLIDDDRVTRATPMRVVPGRMGLADLAAAADVAAALIGVDGMRSRRVPGTTLTPSRGQGFNPRVRMVTPPSLSATFSAVASEINASARVGELLGAEIREGSGSLYGSIALSVPMPEGRDHLKLGDLADAIVNPWDSLQLELAALEFGGEVIVDVAGLNDAPGGPGQVPRFDLVWDDILIADRSVRLQPENL